MYFNSKKNDTNIDKDFNNNKTSFFNKFKVPIIIGIVIIIISIILILVISNNNKTTNKPLPQIETYLVLSGDEVINITQGDDYIEPGYRAYNENNEDLTKDVDITTNLNINQIGEYEITYKIGNVTKTRKINIIDKNTTNEYTYIYLNTVNNNVDMYLNVGEKYNEPGYKVYSTSGKNLNDSVKITGKVDTSKRGNYTLTYSLTDENNKTISVTRTVIVMGVDIKLSLKNNSNGKADINVVVDADYFDYLVLPDGTKVTKSNYTYTVNKNGTYKFTAYSKKGMVKSSSIEVKSIDTTPPSIKKCEAIFKDNSTTFTINSNDTDIAKYVVNNNSSQSYTKNSFTISGIIKNANITVYDKSNNKTTVSCPGYYEQVKPKNTENIKYSEETETLKVSIEFNKRNSGIDYYTTYIWVKDAYKQFKSQVPNNYGKERLLPKKLIENAVKDNNLENKLVVGINASGYEGSGKYVNTPAMPLVISNGKIIRNDTNNSSVSGNYNTYGMTKNGTLKYYQFKGKNPKNVAQNIFDDGVQNTFGWFYRLVVDGKASYKSNTRSVLQGICQINENNFVFITDIYESSRTGFTYTKLGEYMVSLGCQTGYNLDGGGSVQLVYKPSNGTPVELTKNPNNRPMPDVIYFHE